MRSKQKKLWPLQESTPAGKMSQSACSRAQPAADFLPPGEATCPIFCLALNTNVPGLGKAGSLVLQACACSGLNRILKIHMLSPDPQGLRMDCVWR